MVAGAHNPGDGFRYPPHYNFFTLKFNQKRMKEVTLLFLMLLATFVAFGQNTVPPTCNIAVGKQTVMAVYPDEAEFLLIAPYKRLMIVSFDQTGRDSTTAYEATLSKLAPDIYRAEVSPEFWVEVYTSTGTTIFQNGSTQAFFRPKVSGKK